MKKNIKRIVMTSLLWKLLEKFGVQGVQFILQIILARLLSPKDYGLIAIITIFITISNVFIQRGFSSALIQKSKTTSEDFNSVFTISSIIAVFLYGILYFTAPFIARFYGETKLILILRILSIILFFGCIRSLQNAFIAKNFMFKVMFKSSMITTIISGVISIIMAYKGYGVWSLVVLQLINQILIVLIISINIKWIPKISFKFTNTKKLFKFGWKITVSSLIDNLYCNISSLIIGKSYNIGVLGYYNRGRQFPAMIVMSVDGSIQSVIFPVLSKFQDDKKKLKMIVRKSIVSSSFINFPLMVGLAVISEPLIRVILTEKWLLAVPFLKIFCATYALYPIHTINLQAINALGKSDIYLKLEILKKIVGFIILIISINFGVHAISLGIFFTGLISTFINIYPNKKLLNYGYFEQIKDIYVSLIMSFLMGITTYGVGLFFGNEILKLCIQIVFGITFYILMAYFLKLDIFSYIKISLKEVITKDR